MTCQFPRSFFAASVLALGLGACSQYEVAPSDRSPVDPYPGSSNAGPRQIRPMAQPPQGQQWPTQPRMAPGQSP